MRFRVLGPTEARGDADLHSVGGPKQRTILALLITHAGQPVATDFLVDEAYRGAPPDGGRRTVQTLVSNLRAELGDEITSAGHGYQLNSSRADIDLFMFEDLVTASRDAEPSDAGQLLRKALGLWRGHAFADTEGSEYLDTESRRLDELRMQALEARIDADLATGYHRDLIAELESLTIEYPLRERFTEQQMVALYRSGRQAEALRAYEKTRNYLITEMGLDPSPQLRELEQRILEHDPSLDLEQQASIKRAAVMVTDIANPPSLSMLTVAERSDLLDSHGTAIADAAERHIGTVFATSGSASYLTFGTAADAAAAAGEIQHRLDGIDSPGHRLRIAIDVGDIETGDSITGPPVNRAAAIVSAGHGGQVLLSANAQNELSGSSGGGWVLRSLGSQELRGLDAPETVHQLVVDGLPDRFPPLRTEAAPATLPLVSRGLAGYELREEVGAGAFGVVHRAYQPSVGREVAIKVIRPEWANQPDFIRRFEVEAQLIARLEHPHIVPLYDYWREPDRAYLVMRWLRGGNLQERLEDGPLTIPEVTAILEQLAPALATAHRNGVVHRDLKPANVLMDRDGYAYLTDFGIAKDFGVVPTDLLDEAAVAGSPTYITPEQASGAEVTPATDIYALGALIAECLTSDRSGARPNLGDLPVATRDLIATATAHDPADRFASVQDLFSAWVAAVGLESQPPSPAIYTETRNPYKGLSAFTELDAGDFYGRDALVNQLVAATAADGLVAVVGPSGIGKSSVVKAGLLPALRDDALPDSSDWLITTMVPGAYPFDELASALLRIADRAPTQLEELLQKDARGLTRSVARYLPEGATALIVIDQFEELFTLCDDVAVRQLFLQSIAEASADAATRVKVVVTIRADFFDHPLSDPHFGELLQRAVIPVAAPSRDELLAMIRTPAESLGVRFEAGLPEQLADQVVGEAGALPLLEFTLQELFDRRESDTIAVSLYESIGGVLESLGRRAEATYQSVAGASARATRDIFLRLTAVSDAGRDTRRRVRITEMRHLPYLEDEIDGVIAAFVGSRLITTDRDPTTRSPTVEVAHEALLTSWDRLEGWLDASRSDLLAQRRLLAAVVDWDASGRETEYLLSGARLSQAEALQAGGSLALTDVEAEFVQKSRDHVDDLDARRHRRRLITMGGFAAAAIVAAVLAAVALIASANASAERDIAQARALAGAAIGVLDEDPELGLLLAVEASRTDQLDFEGRKALRAAVAAHKASWTIPFDHPRLWTTRSALSADGMLLAAQGDSEALEVWDLSTGPPSKLWSLKLDRGYAITADFTVDGTMLVVLVEWLASQDPTLTPDPPDPELVDHLRLYDARTGEYLRSLRSIPGQCTPYWAPEQRYNWEARYELEGAWIEFGSCTENDDEMFLWQVDIDTEEQVGEPIDVSAANTFSVTSDGWVITVENHGFESSSVTRIHLESGETSSLETERLFHPWFSPSGRYLIGSEHLIEAATGRKLWRYTANEYQFEAWIHPCIGVDFNDDETLTYISCDTGKVRVYDTRTGRLVTTLAGHDGWVHTGPSGSGTAVSTGAGDGTIRLWDLSRPRGVESYPVGSGYNADSSLHIVGGTAALLTYPSAEFTPFDNATSSQTRVLEGVAVVFNPATGEKMASVDGLVGKVVRLSPDETRLAAQHLGTDDQSFGPIQIVDLSGAETVVLDGSCDWSPVGNFFRAGSEECPPGGMPFAIDVTDISWSPDGTLVAASTGRSKRVAVWDAATGDMVFSTEPLGTYPFSSVQFSNDGSMLTASSKTGTWTFETTGWTEIAMVTHPGRPSWVMRFTPDDSELVTAQAHRGQIRVYDTSDWTERNLATGLGQTRDMALSPDGTLVALANNVGVVHIVSLESGEIVDTYPLPGADITNVEFLHNNTHLLVTDAFGPIELLTLDEEELAAVGAARLYRTFTDEECAAYGINRCPTLEELRSG